jgi:hypothetical protein
METSQARHKHEAYKPQPHRQRCSLLENHQLLASPLTVMHVTHRVLTLDADRKITSVMSLRT